jgi:hypothetical protein
MKRDDGREARATSQERLEAPRSLEARAIRGSRVRILAGGQIMNDPENT